MSYTLTQADYSRLKSSLTRRLTPFNKATRHSKERILAAKQLRQEVNRAMSIFEKKGYPDQWSNWERAGEDADFEIRTKPTRE